MTTAIRRPRTFADLERGEHLGHLVDVVDLDRGCLAQHLGKDARSSGQPAGMAVHGGLRARAAADLEDDDRLVGCRSTLDRQAEALWVARRFEKKRDNGRVLVIDHGVDVVGGLKHRLVPGRYGNGKAEPPGIAEKADGDRSALRNEADIAAQAIAFQQRQLVGRGAGMGVDRSHAVRPAERDAVGPAIVGDRVLPGQAVRAAFRKAAVVDDGRVGADLAQIRKMAEDGVSARADRDDIRRGRQLLEILKAAIAGDFLVARIDRPDLAGIAAASQ